MNKNKGQKKWEIMFWHNDFKVLQIRLKETLTVEVGEELRWRRTGVKGEYWRFGNSPAGYEFYRPGFPTTGDWSCMPSQEPNTSVCVRRR